MTKPTKQQIQAMLHKGRTDPEWWFREVLGVRLWAKQLEIAESVRDHTETSVKACHSSGKSFDAAAIVLWFVCCHVPAVAITTAPTDRQVKGILWKEIGTLHAKARYPLGGEVLTQEWKIRRDWWAWGFTAAQYDPDRFQGFHARHLLVVVDEASGVSPEIMQAIDGIMAGGVVVRLLRIGNPTNPASDFARSFKQRSTSKFTISAYDTPNFTELGITEKDIIDGKWEAKCPEPDKMPFPGLVTPSWVRGVYERRGLSSPFYQARVKGEFPAEGESTLIPYSWIEQAKARATRPDLPHILAEDVGRYGSSETTVGQRRGWHFRIVEARPRTSGVEARAMGRRWLVETGAEVLRIDESGVGGPVLDELLNDAELQGRVEGVLVGRASSDPDMFKNLRAEMFWRLREAFEKQPVDIDPDDMVLEEQLACLEYDLKTGVVKVTSKEDMMKQGLPSPDRADTMAMAFLPPIHGQWTGDAAAILGTYESHRDRPTEATAEPDIMAWNPAAPREDEWA